MKPLSPYRCSVHNHTTLCDGKGTPEEMAAAAYRAGVRVLGFSGHSHTPLPLDAPYVMPPDLSEYRRRVLDLRRQYAGRMEILLGIEWDLYADGSREGFDYWIGSVHHVLVNGADCPIDYDADHLAAARDSLFGGDIYALAEAYYEAVSETAAQRPTILGHMDLLTKFNEGGASRAGGVTATDGASRAGGVTGTDGASRADGEAATDGASRADGAAATGGAFLDEDHPRYRAAALNALHTADPSATLLEINTGAMSRGYRSAPYPALFLLEAWRRMGGRVILTADSHSPDTLLYGYDSAAAAARTAGFTSCAVLTADGVRECGL